MRKMSTKKQALRVMGDFSSSGIWDSSPNGKNEQQYGTMIDYDELKLPKELIREFETWIAFYETCFFSDYSTMKKEKTKKMNEMGLALAVKLKQRLPERIIFYWEEKTVDGKFILIKHKIESEK